MARGPGGGRGRGSRQTAVGEGSADEWPPGTATLRGFTRSWGGWYLRPSSPCRGKAASPGWRLALPGVQPWPQASLLGFRAAFSDDGDGGGPRGPWGQATWATMAPARAAKGRVSPVSPPSPGSAPVTFCLFQGWDRGPCGPPQAREDSAGRSPQRLG